MTRADRDRLVALLSDLQGLARSAQLCVEHTTVPDDGSAYAKKYRRTPDDVRRWLALLDDAHGRLAVVQATIPALHPPTPVG